MKPLERSVDLFGGVEHTYLPQSKELILTYFEP